MLETVQKLKPLAKEANLTLGQFGCARLVLREPNIAWPSWASAARNSSRKMQRRAAQRSIRNCSRRQKQSWRARAGLTFNSKLKTVMAGQPGRRTCSGGKGIPATH